MRGRIISGIEDDVILLAGLGIGAWLLIQHFTGSGTDPVITSELNLPPSQNPFSYQFQPFIDFYNNNTPTIQTSGTPSSVYFLPWFNSTSVATSSPTVQQFFQSLKANPPASSVWGFLNTIDLSQRAERLNDAISVSAFNPLSMSDQSAALSALAGLSNQLQVAFIANYFWWNFNMDLLTFLQGSLFKPGLSSDNLVTLINSVNSLPVNPS